MYIKRSLDFYNPLYQLQEKIQELDGLFKRLNQVLDRKIEYEKNRLSNLINKLNLLNPTTSLDRGYSILLDKDGNMITTIASVADEDELRLLLKDGIIHVKVVNICKGEFCHDQ